MGNTLSGFFILIASFTALLGGLAVVALLLIAVHEGGHLLAVIRCRLRWHSVKIGPLLFRSGSSGVEGIQLGFGYGHVEFDGYAATRRQMVVILIAGPAANILFALLMGELEQRFLMHISDAGELCAGVAVLSMITGLVNLLPFRVNDHRSDGLQLLDIYRAGRTREPTITNRLGGDRYHKVPRTAHLKEDLPEADRVNIDDLPKW